MVALLLAGGVSLFAEASGLLTVQASSDESLGIIGLFFAGLYLVYHGFKKWKQMRLMQDTPTEKVRSAAVGRTELSGTAKPIDGVGTIPQPFTDGRCLVATYEVEEWEEDNDDDGGGHWDTIKSGTLTKPFHLDDGTGKMRVEPEQDATYEVSGSNRTRFRVGAGNRPPDEVVEFFERTSDNDDDGLLGGILSSGDSVRGSEKRRYTQEVIPPHEDVYLLGGAEPRDDASGSNADRLVLRSDEGSDEFIVSDMNEENLVSTYKWRAPAEIVGGIVLSATMLYLILG